MPLVRIGLVAGKAATYRTTVGEVVYAAMLETLNVPVDDRFQIVCEHPDENMIVGPDLPWHRPFERLHRHPIDAQRRPDRRAEARVLQSRGRRLERAPRNAARRRLHQLGGGAQGKLVVRKWRGAVRIRAYRASSYELREAATLFS